MSRIPLPPGTDIDRYMIKQMLSEDGRGISYLAVDLRSVSGSAKVLVREYFPRGVSVRTPDGIEPRDRLEAQKDFERGLDGFIKAGRSLNSFKTHSLVPALDVVEENSTAYLVLEWPEGRDFTEIVTSEDPMSLEMLRSQLEILQTGLDSLHDAGLIHTAISPATLIRLDDGYPAISHLTHVESFRNNTLNRAHVLFDTPYAAPELRSDSDAPVGPWTDVYGLAATCWYMLTGTAPASAEERMSFMASGRGDKLSADAFVSLEGDMTKVASVLLAGMDLVPERRLPTAAAFISALEAASVGPTWLGGAAAFGARHKIALLGTAAALAFSVAVTDFVSGEKQGKAPSITAALPDAEIPETELAASEFPEKISADVDDSNTVAPRIIASAAWLLVDRNSTEAVRDFLSEYGGDANATAEALEQLQLLDERAWSVAQAGGTAESYSQYLGEFGPEARPVGIYVDDAKAQIIKLAGAREFQIAEARRLLFELGYNTNRRTGETPGLKRAVMGFQESIGAEIDGEFSELLIEQLSEAVTAKAEETAAAEELARREEEAVKAAKEKALAQARYVELVRKAAKSPVRTATAETGRIVEASDENLRDTSALVSPPIVEPKIIFETKVAGSKLARGKIALEELAAKQEPVRNPGDTFRDCDSCPDMTVVPAGQFNMGSPGSERDRQVNEGPVRSVQISGNFAIATSEVTRGEYAVFVRETNRRTPQGCYAETKAQAGEWQLDRSLNYRNPGFSQSGDHPAVCISWQDANDYVTWLSRETGQTYRLPSEAEWEYAARAGSQTARHFGRGYRNGCKFANGADRTAKKSRKNWVTATCTDGHLATAPVGSFGSNAFGLHDMIGNVWEWTADCYKDSYNGAPRNEAAYRRAGCKTFVTRGGSWASGIDMLRSAARSGDARSARYDMLGFRVVREIVKP